MFADIFAFYIITITLGDCCVIFVDKIIILFEWICL